MSLLTPLMTRAQLAAELNVGEQTIAIYQKKHANMPSPIKIGSRMYWRRDDIEAWIRSFLPSKNGKAAS